MPTSLEISQLMAATGVRFGTSGVRGLACDLTDRVCYAYALAFLQHLEDAGELPGAGRVALAGDLRASTGRIMAAVAQAVADRGYQPVCCGRIPSPAVALYGLKERIPTVMVTGSHIPADRNGLKFTRASGEILKQDEASIVSQSVALPDSFDDCGELRIERESPLPTTFHEAATAYRQRWLEAFPPDLLKGQKLGLYEHSAVGRELLFEIFTGLGADVIRLGRSESFVPVDTEAIRQEDVELAARWAEEHELLSILSTDGDSDRPLISDEQGRWLRGDIAGILCAQLLEADVVVTPVSCNTAVERCGHFREVRRTRIGSPFVIAEMQRAVRDGRSPVVGYEANGGFLIATDIELSSGRLPALPTRDPVIVQLAILSLAAKKGAQISELVAELPQRATASDRLTGFPTERAAQKVSELAQGGPAAIIKEAFGASLGRVVSTDTTDGLRITFESEEILHLRPSGNAPELRCYAEADSEARARELTALALAVMQTWR